MAVGTGHGATITFGTQSYTASVRSIGGATAERPAIDASHLGTTVSRTKIPGDLVDQGSFDIEVLCDPTKEPPWPTFAVPESVTITYKKSVPLAASAATEVGSAFVTSVGKPTHVTDELMAFPVTITWAGTPAWTKEAAPPA